MNKNLISRQRDSEEDEIFLFLFQRTLVEQTNENEGTKMCAKSTQWHLYIKEK